MLGIERRAWLLAILSAILQIVIFPLVDVYILSWFAVAPLLVAILRARRPHALQLQGAEKLLPAGPAQGFLLGYACGILWYGGARFLGFINTKEKRRGRCPIATCLSVFVFPFFGLV